MNYVVPHASLTVNELAVCAIEDVHAVTRKVWGRGRMRLLAVNPEAALLNQVIVKLARNKLQFCSRSEVRTALPAGSRARWRSWKVPSLPSSACSTLSSRIFRQRCLVIDLFATNVPWASFLGGKHSAVWSTARRSISTSSGVGVRLELKSVSAATIFSVFRHSWSRRRLQVSSANRGDRRSAQDIKLRCIACPPSGTIRIARTSGRHRRMNFLSPPRGGLSAIRTFCVSMLAAFFCRSQIASAGSLDGQWQRPGGAEVSNKRA